MAYELPPLPYPTSALEPTIDAKTMEIHHDKHHQAYVTNLNKALENSPELAALPVDELIADLSKVPEASRTAVRNNGGGHSNHTFFWTLMTPGGATEPSGALGDAIKETFGGLDGLKEKVNAAGAARFGSGWAWLVVGKDGKLEVISTAEPGQPADGRREASDRSRRVGARVLPELPEPPPGLPEGVVGDGKLGRCREELRSGEVSPLSWFGREGTTQVVPYGMHSPVESMLDPLQAETAWKPVSSEFPDLEREDLLGCWISPGRDSGFQPR